MDAGHAFQVALATAREPMVLRMIGWATLAAVLVDVALALLARARVTSLLGALSARARGTTGAVLVGIAHPLLILGAGTVLALAATRVAALLVHWWASGIAIGIGFAGLAWLVERGPAARLAGPLLTGIALALAARLVPAAG